MHLLTLIAAAVMLPMSASPLHGQGADSSRVASYRVYTAMGQPAELEDVFAAAQEAEVVFVGEAHDDSVAHLLQHRILEGLTAQTDRPLVLSLEMFERDVQSVLDEYLAGLITERHFLQSSRPWGNYADYRPLVAFARAQGLPVLAANAPHRYVNRVARLGPEALGALSEEARSMLAPLPYPAASAAYVADWNRAMGEMPAHPPTETSVQDTVDTAHDAASPHGAGHAGASYLLQAQMLRDATMAYTLAERLTRHPGSRILHLTGGFHVEHGTGTPELLSYYRPGTRTLTVLIRPEGDAAAFDPEEHAGLGDFVILTERE